MSFLVRRFQIRPQILNSTPILSTKIKFYPWEKRPNQLDRGIRDFSLQNPNFTLDKIWPNKLGYEIWNKLLKYRLCKSLILNIKFYISPQTSKFTLFSCIGIGKLKSSRWVQNHGNKIKLPSSLPVNTETWR